MDGSLQWTCISRVGWTVWCDGWACVFGGSLYLVGGWMDGACGMDGDMGIWVEDWGICTEDGGEMGKMEEMHMRCCQSVYCMYVAEIES